MTTHEEHLIELFKKAEKESIPGTEYFEALCEFSKECFNTVITWRWCAGQRYSFFYCSSVPRRI